MKVLLGTGNPAKLAEMREILGPIPGVEWVSAAELGLPEPPEEGQTLEENAILKAVVYAKRAGLPTVAEDTGLEVEALGGAPGVLSSRFAGKEKDYAANNRKLLELLEGVADRRARFRTVAVLALPDGRFWKSEGLLEGEIAREPRGSGGFGYDPLFIPKGETRTLAELSPAEKNAISHRRKALEGLRPLLRVLAENPDLLG
ncbi:MAG: RdgB/HAM1 family non-canonical purine NTP pyrophosphatase [Candidatus Bipolaricaulota bacterium]|nr:RdgB/HAM1 family non-canonical purine NTP pyrophosphatase [Candidatus Bipolaricaulota bacterium]MCX7844033.1 RdgB/HAM1 family non-canonical purine NTP pyrophosphatase [Candidatus Bipolaricaulota bacterium]MDW8151981.1 RdgB/HAM1 family non-canonical purine NTP pyrophosphatase [Candidatus Bipolaricaulota bacterium]